MAKTLRSKKKRRWLIPFFVILLTAAGIVLYRYPPSLQDIGRIIQSAVGKISSLSAGQTPAEPVLRGTVYDRKFRELAVSYRLFSLIVNPVEVVDRRKAAEALAPLVGDKVENIELRLKTAQYSMVLSDDLDARQAEQIAALQLRGVTCKATEARFYPGHTAASHVLGFMGDGVGLAGVEGKYDTVLQAGGFRKSNIPDIDFQGEESLGQKETDIVLTLDIDLQRQLENRFREHLAAQGSEKGMGLLIDPSSGRILALVNQPSFNPNYFWKANESNRINRIYNHVLDKELIRPLLARAAAIEREGLDGPGILPATVAAPDYGFTPEQLDAFEQQIQLYGSVFGNWESGPAAQERTGAQPVVTGVQVGVTLASLVNGGWRITPYVVDSIYDHATMKRYSRSNEATEKIHVLDPALGVKIRRELFANWLLEQENLVVFTADHVQIQPDKDQYSRYSMQDLFVGLAPAKQPKFLLLMAVEQDHLLPVAQRKDNENGVLELMGKELLAALAKVPPPDALPEKPPEKSEENLRQFFISKRLNFRNAPGKANEPIPRMPQLRGMSLRKGLQQIDKYKMTVRVNGSGRIIAQYPLPGQPLTGVDECILTLDSK
ncbi:Penicillin-binding protein dimerization domain protein [Desulfobulbus propionicus DSM 2032]|uniref:beta-lactamase n=1 Tax=Desulfobulbus propionicus (strain ATCC 33891 / DSM 2032 / VKM B-1956 / 1pr3) TaxID=577650 RepID=A0A7U3YK43_DESPD|nr:Penicillin-binding protein dimerization domain-containing protein [Desulfobulbus propionicus]ADW16865.1 Penicillin-binding protein dimerization domain protein [Desulfobulbus propionicus DSM 2032]